MKKLSVIKRLKPTQCAICQNYSGKKVKACKSGHKFHKECIREWFNVSQNPSCPLCRQKAKVKKTKSRFEKELKFLDCYYEWHRYGGNPSMSASCMRYVPLSSHGLNVYEYADLLFNNKELIDYIVEDDYFKQKYPQNLFGYIMEKQTVYEV
jgi:hypothetical protein